MPTEFARKTGFLVVAALVMGCGSSSSPSSPEAGSPAIADSAAGTGSADGAAAVDGAVTADGAIPADQDAPRPAPDLAAVDQAIVGDAPPARTDGAPIGSGAIVVITQPPLETSESGETATFTVALSSSPASVVTVTLRSTSPGEGTPSPTTLTFTADTWSAPQVVTVTGVDDATADGDEPFTVTGEVASSDPNYQGLAGPTVALTNLDDDMPGIVVEAALPLATTEAGGSATFTVALRSQPTADVTIAVASGDATEAGVAPAGLTFTAANWNAPQTVTVTGVDDAIADGAQMFAVLLAPAQSTDRGYAGQDAADLAGGNADDDSPGIVVGAASGPTTGEAGGQATFTVVLGSQPTHDVVLPIASADPTEGAAAPAALTFTAANWNAPQMVTVAGVDDPLDDGDQAYVVTVGAAVSDDAAYRGLDPSDVMLSNLDDDVPGIAVQAANPLVTTEGGGTATFTIALASQPAADVTVALWSTKPTEGTASPASVTFTALQWGARTITVTGVNDAVADGPQNYAIVTAPATSADPSYHGLDAPNVAATNTDNDAVSVPVGITVSPTADLITNESGGTATFTVVLAGPPGANVTIPLTSSDLTEGAVAPASLTFTTMNWNMAQTVTVTGVNDVLADGNVMYTINVGVAVSADPAYAGMDPTDVTATNITAVGMVSAGSNFGTCAITAGGTPYCWVFNGDGQLGDTSIDTRLVPTAVVGGLTLSRIAIRNFHACGVATNNAAHCWGLGTFGRLGDGLSASSTSPVTVAGGLTLAEISPGQQFTCALTTAGAAYCWGNNTNGQLGDGTTNPQSSPTPIAGVLTFTQIAAGASHACGLAVGGSVYCWGNNASGRCGNGVTGGDITTPTQVSGAITFASIVSMNAGTCGRTAGGAVYCWGLNDRGQVGDGTMMNRNVPTAVNAGTPALASLAATSGVAHTCGITAGGNVYCWGANLNGQLGDGTTTDRLVPTPISSSRTFSAITAGNVHTCGLSNTQLLCWGGNTNGQLGNGTTDPSLTPVVVPLP